MNASHKPSSVIPGHHVQIVSAPMKATPVETRPHALNASHLTCTKEPRISVIKEADTVRVIEVVCTCGEVIRLECEY